LPSWHVGESGTGESTLTVIVALVVNALIAVMKAVAGALTGSAAMLAEAAHSVADTTTEGLLLAALRRSQRPADWFLHRCCVDIPAA